MQRSGGVNRKFIETICSNFISERSIFCWQLTLMIATADCYRFWGKGGGKGDGKRGDRAMLIRFKLDNWVTMSWCCFNAISLAAVDWSVDARQAHSSINSLTFLRIPTTKPCSRRYVSLIAIGLPIFRRHCCIESTSRRRHGEREEPITSTVTSDNDCLIEESN